MNPLPLKLKMPLSKAKLLRIPGDSRMRKVLRPAALHGVVTTARRLFGAELEPDYLAGLWLVSGKTIRPL